jgi:hypothetical protein
MINILSAALTNVVTMKSVFTSSTTIAAVLDLFYLMISAKKIVPRTFEKGQHFSAARDSASALFCDNLYTIVF